MLFVVKLRRRIRAKVLVRDLADLESISDGSDNPMSKKVPLEQRHSVVTLKRGDRPPSSDILYQLKCLLKMLKW